MVSLAVDMMYLLHDVESLGIVHLVVSLQQYEEQSLLRSLWKIVDQLDKNYVNAVDVSGSSYKYQL